VIGYIAESYKNISRAQTLICTGKFAKSVSPIYFYSIKYGCSCLSCRTGPVGRNVLILNKVRWRTEKEINVREEVVNHDVDVWHRFPNL